MEDRRLTPDIVSVIHHIELNEIGWWESSLKRIILIVLWIENKSQSVNEIQQEISNNIGLNVPLPEIIIQIDELSNEGKILQDKSGHYQIARSASTEIQKNVTSTEKMFEKVKIRFSEHVKLVDESIDTNDLWEKLNEDLIIPSVKMMGSRLYQLLLGENPDFNQVFEVSLFLNQFPEESQNKIKNIVVSFLASHDNEIRNYILSFIRLHFILESGKLGKETITSLYRSMKDAPSLTIFADTNFIFSILGIHNNPSDEDAESLIKVINQLSERFLIKLYVLPITLEETRKAIQWRVDETAGITFSTNLANVSKNRKDLSGFLTKLINEVEKTGQKLSVEEFYGPYITNLLDIVRSKGVELFNCDLNVIENDPDVQSDIAGQYEFEQSHYGKNAKKYDAIKHDMFLWHLIHQKRSEIEESPLDVNYWIVTVDFHLLRFDQYKISQLEEEYPITLHPSTVIQMLQFWIPRSDEFEELIYHSWLSPLFYEAFDDKSEAVTIKILRTLSRYENVDDLPPEIVRKIIVDDVMRQKLSDGVDHTEEEISKFIDETIIRETRILANQVETQKRDSEQKAKIIKNQATNINEKEQKILEKDAEILSLTNQINQKDAKIALILEEVNQNKLIKEKKAFIFKWVYFPIVIISICLMVSIYLVSRFTVYNIPILTSTIWLLIYILVSSLITKKKLINSKYDLGKLIDTNKKVRAWVIWVLLFSIAVEIIASCGVNEYRSILDLWKK